MSIRAIAGGWIKNGRGSANAASLSLNFLDGSTDYRITYSGGANGTRVNSAGLIVAATTPRFDYDPVTLAAKGLLLEAAATNLLLRSEEFDNASWVKTNVTATANAIVAPDGATTADSILHTSVSTVMLQTVTITAGSTVTASVYAKKFSSDFIRFELGNLCSCWFNVSTGVTASNGGGSGSVLFSAKSISAVGNGWYRCSLTVSTSTITSLTVAISATNTDGSGASINSSVYLWGAQLEAGSYPTSYIPTTSASVTRTADSAVMTGTNFSSWYNPTESTFVAAFDIPYAVPSTSGPRVLCTSDATSESTNGQLIFSPGITGKICAINTFSGGVNAGRLDAVEANTPNAVIKAAATFALNDRALSVNGVTPVTSGSGALPVGVDRLYIGGGATVATYLNGHIRTIQYFPRRLANEQLQALTA